MRILVMAAFGISSACGYQYAQTSVGRVVTQTAKGEPAIEVRYDKYDGSTSYIVRDVTVNLMDYSHDEISRRILCNKDENGHGCILAVSRYGNDWLHLESRGDAIVLLDGRRFVLSLLSFDSKVLNGGRVRESMNFRASDEFIERWARASTASMKIGYKEYPLEDVVPTLAEALPELPLGDKVPLDASGQEPLVSEEPESLDCKDRCRAETANVASLKACMAGC